MRNSPLVIGLLSLFVFASSCNSVESRDNDQSSYAGAEINQEKKNNLQLLGDLRMRGVTMVGEWDVGEEISLTYIVERYGSKSQLSILDASGVVLYQKREVSVERVYESTALRTVSKQLVFEYSEGGNDSYVQMLDFDHKKVQEKIDATDDQNAFGADIGIHPQFRSGVDATKEPFEIVLTDLGLASPALRKAKVFRFDGNKYRLAGTFDRREADDCKEKLLGKK